MKLMLMTVGLLALSGCSHAYVRDFQGNEVTACCPLNGPDKVFCKKSALESQAIDHCGGPVRSLSGSTVDTGTQANYKGKTLFHPAHASVTEGHELCVTFECQANK